MSCTYLKQKSSLIHNLKLTPFFIILSLVIENYINFIFYTFITFIFLLVFFEVPAVNFIIFYAASIFFFVIVLCLSYFLSYAHTLYKDVKYIVQFIFTLLYFLTPTFYLAESMPESVQQLIKYNPLYWIVSLFRIELTLIKKVSTIEILIVCFVLFCILVLGTYFFTKKLKNKVYLKL